MEENNPIAVKEEFSVKQQSGDKWSKKVPLRFGFLVRQIRTTPSGYGVGVMR